MEAPDRTAYETSVEMDLGNNRGLVSFREKKPFRKRNDAALEGVERKCLALLDTECMQFFRNNKLKPWPHYFDTPEQCGEEMQKGWLVNAAVEQLPCCGNPSRCSCHPTAHINPRSGESQLRSLRAAVDAGTAVRLARWVWPSRQSSILGYLLSVSGKLTWIWVCRLGPLRGLPTLILVLDTLLSLLAIGFTVWTLYGPAMPLD